MIFQCGGPSKSPENSTNTKEASTDPKTEGEFQDKYRPQFHFTPKTGWMNDPNGMFYHQGEYHLFYQHYPDSTVWGPMHWGHAVSKDMIHWEHLPIALYPDSLGYIFSGSAVVDTQNSSGLGTKENPPIVAIFTYHKMEGEKAGRIDYQTQGIAYSTDKGRTWTKYKGNPVVPNPGIRDFRDPKVAWDEDTKQWVMTLAVKDHIEFYASKDLKKWNKLSEFGKNDGGHGGVWECPDLFKLKDQNGNMKYVLLVSINPGGPNGGSATQYFTGHFDGKKFISDTPGKNVGWIDYGTDNYAGVTFSNIPQEDGRRILIGWMSNWLYANQVPTEKWRSAMTIPRVFSLKQMDNGHVLVSTPVKELENISGARKSIEIPSDKDTLDISAQSGINITTSVIEGVANKDFTLMLSNSGNENVKVGFDSKKNRFFIDRKQSGDLDFSEKYVTEMYAPRIVKGDKIKFKAVVDVASIEVFFDDGATVMTAVFFPDQKFDKASIYGLEQNKIESLQVQEISSIWTQKAQ